MPMTAHDTALAELSKQQNRLSRLLLAADRDMPAIAEQADRVRRCERVALALDRDGR